MESQQYLAYNKVLEEKRLNSRNELRLHQFKQADEASSYATAALRAIFLLNAGALALIPTFISSFALTNINSDHLESAMMLFIYGLVVGLFIYILAYLSASFGARASLAQAECEHWLIGINVNSDYNLEVPTQWREDYTKFLKQFRFFLKLCDWLEGFAIALSISAVILFLCGARHATKAIPTSSLMSNSVATVATPIQETTTPSDKEEE